MEWIEVDGRDEGKMERRIEGNEDQLKEGGKEGM